MCFSGGEAARSKGLPRPHRPRPVPLRLLGLGLPQIWKFSTYLGGHKVNASFFSRKILAHSLFSRPHTRTHTGEGVKNGEASIFHFRKQKLPASSEENSGYSETKMDVYVLKAVQSCAASRLISSSTLEEMDVYIFQRPGGR